MWSFSSIVAIIFPWGALLAADLITAVLLSRYLISKRAKRAKCVIHMQANRAVLRQKGLAFHHVGTGLRRRSRSRYVRDLIAGSTNSTSCSRRASVLAFPLPPPNFNYYPIRYCHSETPLFSSRLRDEQINRARWSFTTDLFASLLSPVMMSV